MGTEWPVSLSDLRAVLIFLRSFLSEESAVFRFGFSGENLERNRAIAFLVAPQVARLVNIKRVTAL